MHALLNIEKRNAESPTFEIPSLIERRSLVKGDLAKLVFVIDPPMNGCEGERMWVEVTAIERGVYTGRLCNDPAFLGTIERGAEVEFGPEHVASIETGAERAVTSN